MNDTSKFGYILAESFQDEIVKCKNMEEIEDLCISIGNKITAEFISSTLELLDENLYKEKDPEYKVHSRRKRTLLTEVGDVVFSRRVYKDRYGNMSYLLDEEIDLPKNAQLSPGAYNYLVDVGCEKSYAKACKMLARRGSIVKPTTAMKAIRKLGEICRNEDICLAESLYCNGEIPKSECCEESLNIESDGTYVKMQDGSKIEISALVAYPGKEIQGERTARINPFHFACVGNMNEFWTQGFASIGTRFDLSSIKNIHMGFDGEAEYKNGE